MNVKREDAESPMEVAPSVTERPAYKHAGHMSKAFEVLNVLRRQNLLCDIVLVADGLEIPCHRAVLAACSPYFYAMFTSDLAEARADRIVLQEIDGKALSLLIDFVYSGEVQVTEENVQVCSDPSSCV